MTHVLKAKPHSIAGKGRGLVAVVSIPAGELIESAPTVVLSSDDCDRIEATALGDHYFAHPRSDEQGMIVLGLASLANHADSPNAEVTWQCDNGIGWIAELRALRSIDEGEEITYRYRCSPWFKVVP